MKPVLYSFCFPANIVKLLLTPSLGVWCSMDTINNFDDPKNLIYDSALMVFEGPCKELLTGRRCAIPESTLTLDQLAVRMGRVLQPIAIHTLEQSHIEHMVLTRGIMAEGFYCQSLLNRGNLEPEQSVLSSAEVCLEYTNIHTKAVTLTVGYKVLFGTEMRDNLHQFEFSVPGCSYLISKNCNGNAGPIIVSYCDSVLQLKQTSYRGVKSDTYTVELSPFPFTVGFESGPLHVMSDAEVTDELRSFQQGDDDWSELLAEIEIDTSKKK